MTLHDISVGRRSALRELLEKWYVFEMPSQWTQIPSLQAKLDRQIRGVARSFPKDLLKTDVLGLLLMGSCARGEATYRSDVDFLVILKGGALTFSRVKKLRDCIENRYTAPSLLRPLRCEFHFVLPTVFKTKEPAMAKGLLQSVVLLDPMGTLTKEKVAK